MDFSNLESLLGIEKGTMENMPKDKLIPDMVKGVDDKAKDLKAKFKESSKEIKRVDDNNSLSLETLEDDRKKIIEEAVLTYEVSKRLLIKIEEMINDKINPSDKDFTAAAALLNSVTATLKTLKEINREYRQEEEMKRLSMMNETANEDGTMDLSPDAIARFLEDHLNRNQKTDEMAKAQDAILVDGEPVDPEAEDDIPEEDK